MDTLFYMEPIRIVHCRKDKFDVYCGRTGFGFEDLGFGNPFKVGVHGARGECVYKFEDYLVSNPELIERCKEELRGKVLGCWCAPLGGIRASYRPYICHCQILSQASEGHYD